MTHAAGPLLGSHIWAAHCNTLTDLNALSRSAVSTTGCNALDNVLHAGANSRLHDLCCVSGNVTPAGAIVRTLVVAHLLSTHGVVYIVDTRGTFDVELLAEAIASRIRNMPRSEPLNADVDVSADVMSMLDRVKILRAFDIEGAVEAIAEIRDLLGTKQKPMAASGLEEHDVTGSGMQDEGKAPRGTVQDSQADDDDDELLLETYDASVKSSMPRDTKTAIAEPDNARQSPLGAKTSHDQAMLVMDDLSSIFMPLIRANYTRGQALLDTFLRSLRHLHTQHHLTSILVNAVVNVYRRGLTNDETSTGPPPRPTETSPSIFASACQKPALGRGLDRWLDYHLFVHAIPHTEKDAKYEMMGTSAAAQGTTVDEADHRAKVRYVHIAEVLLDRSGPRTERFGAFDVGLDGLIKDVF